MPRFASELQLEETLLSMTFGVAGLMIFGAMACTSDSGTAASRRRAASLVRSGIDQAKHIRRARRGNVSGQERGHIKEIIL